MKGTAVHIISNTEAPKPNVGSAMAALLAQVPTALAEQIRDAWHDDLSRIFQVGLAGGRNNAFTAMAEQGLIPGDTVTTRPAPSRPSLRLVLGGAPR